MKLHAQELKIIMSNIHVYPVKIVVKCEKKIKKLYVNLVVSCSYLFHVLPISCIKTTGVIIKLGVKTLCETESHPSFSVLRCLESGSELKVVYMWWSEKKIF